MPQWPQNFGGRLLLVILAAVFILCLFGLIAPSDFLAEHHTNAAQVMSTFWALVGGMVIILAIFHWDQIESPPRAILIAILGAALGWLLGMYISPMNTLERQEFAGYKSALVGAVSGYVLSKLQSFIDSKFKDPNELTIRRQAYIIVFLASTMLTVAVIYNVRAYGVAYVKISIKNATNLLFESEGNLAGKATPTADEDKFVQMKCDGTDGPIVFQAESTISNDSSVSWSAVSTDPADDSKISGKFDDPRSGIFTVNKDQCELVTDIVARSNGDPTVAGRYSLKIKNPTKKQKEKSAVQTNQNQSQPVQPATIGSARSDAGGKSDNTPATNSNTSPKPTTK